MKSEQLFLKEVGDYMIYAIRKIKPNKSNEAEFRDLMLPAMDLLDNAGISLQDVELKGNTIRISYK